ncbi:hypothetical protein QYE76_066706 [Lolium multiflorum]|uniref:Uncharacterized protein n=1 Tax=Lolium multiflorum TaxID=4521 RepID=A0AAD8WA19_LOLMU|nr:hypothetical protein QYE76_066706 [Lolium multiflorum]
MTRARAKAIHDKVNSLLTTLDLGTPLDGMLPHAETLCVIRYVEHHDPGEDDTPWSREGEEQLVEKMYMELDPKSPEERKEEKMSGQSRIRSGLLTGPPGPQPASQPVPSGRHPGAPEPRPVAARSRARSRTGLPGPRSGDEPRDGEVLRNTERLVTQHNLWAQRQEFKEQLTLFETRIDEQYEEVAHNFGQVNQDMNLLCEATDNLHHQVTANDANMERRMDSLERAITNLGRRHRHALLPHRHQPRRTMTTLMIAIRPQAPTQGMEIIIDLVDRMLVKMTLAQTQGAESSIAMLVLMNVLNKNKLFTKIVIKRLAMPTMGMTTNVLHNMEPTPHRQAHVDAQDQGHQDPPRRDLRNHPRHDQRGRDNNNMIKMRGPSLGNANNLVKIRNNIINVSQVVNTGF